jgi:alkyldihydroxyacetonephosphate synthase
VWQPPPVRPGSTEPIRLAPESLERAQALKRALERLDGVCEVRTEDAAKREYAQDWWPLGLALAARNTLISWPDAVALPSSYEEVSAVLAAANAERVPVTPVGGRSGVCGGAVPVAGGISLDTSRLKGVLDIDEESLVVRVRSGTLGPELEDALESVGLTLGHFPQSFALSSVGGWLSCRSAGQFSNRYSKVEENLLGMKVALADGRIITLSAGIHPAAGPDLSRVFVGAEGTLGVILEADLCVRRRPAARYETAFSLASFEEGLRAARRAAQQGVLPAVLRVYDAAEARLHFEIDGAVAIVIEEGSPDPSALVSVLREIFGPDQELGPEPARRWMEKRNDVSALPKLIGKGLVVETLETSVPWAGAASAYAAGLSALSSVPETVYCSAHASHFYTSGACLYFTLAADLAGAGPEEVIDYYRRATDSFFEAVLANGGSLSHHHGIGLARAKAYRHKLPDSFSLLRAIKQALDEHGILNPGKLGLDSPLAGSLVL